jgi:hypothetical protein
LFKNTIAIVTADSVAIYTVTAARIKEFTLFDILAGVF